MGDQSRPRLQRGVAPVIVVIIVVVVVVAIIGAIVVGTSTPSTPGTPPSGCFPAGTQCRLFVQNEVSCCGGTPVVGQRIGWCIGWWDGIPCRGGSGMNDMNPDQILFALAGEDCPLRPRPVCAASQPPPFSEIH